MYMCCMALVSEFYSNGADGFALLGFIRLTVVINDDVIFKCQCRVMSLSFANFDSQTHALTGWIRMNVKDMLQPLPATTDDLSAKAQKSMDEN